MSDRTVPMSEEQAEILDEIIIPALMKMGETEKASHMMTLALAWRFAPDAGRSLPDNVVPIMGAHSIRA